MPLPHLQIKVNPTGIRVSKGEIIMGIGDILPKNPLFNGDSDGYP